MDHENEECERQICTVMTNADLLQKADYGDIGRFAGTISNIFDLDPMIVGRVMNLDYLRRPIIGTDKVNYIQWITLEDKSTEHEPIDAILSYLFCVSDSHLDKEYMYSDSERRRINTHLFKIVTNYEDTKNIPYGFVEQYYGSMKLDRYFEIVSEKLWKDSKFLHGHYAFHRERAVRKIDRLLRMK